MVKFYFNIILDVASNISGSRYLYKHKMEKKASDTLASPANSFFQIFFVTLLISVVILREDSLHLGMSSFAHKLFEMTFNSKRSHCKLQCHTHCMTLFNSPVVCLNTCHCALNWALQFIC